MKTLNKIALAGALISATEIHAARTERVTFQSEGTEIVGTLYLPDDRQSHTRHTAAVVGGSLTSVKEMMAGTYAQQLAEQGIVALAIDYRNYGESGGRPRQFEDPQLKAADLSASVSYLASRDDVHPDRIALVGICTSGGNVLYAAAQDKRVAAVATVAGWFAEPALTPLLYGSEANVSDLRAAAAQARADYEGNNENTTILAYSDTDQTASHVGPMEYYMDETRGGGVPEWANSFSVMSWSTWLDFDPVSQAAEVTAPTLIIHSDHSALPDQARRVHELLAGPKQLYWTEGGHFDFYDQPAQVADASRAIASFLNLHL